MDRENPSQRLKSELRKQQYTVTRFDCSHLAQVLILLQVQKFVCYSTVFDLCYFEFEYNFQVQAPRGLYLEGRFIGGGGGCVSSLGALYMEGLIFGILRYLSYSWK